MYLELVNKARRNYRKYTGKELAHVKMSQEFYDGLVKECEEKYPMAYTPDYKTATIYGMIIEIVDGIEE